MCKLARSLRLSDSFSGELKQSTVQVGDGVSKRTPQMVAVIKAPERTEFSLVVYRLLWGLEKRVENARLHAAKCVVQTCGSGTGPAPLLSILFPWAGSVTKSEARLVASRLQPFSSL